MHAAYKFESGTGQFYKKSGIHPVGKKMTNDFVSNINIERVFIEVEAWPLSEELPEDYDVWQHEAEAISACCQRSDEPPPFNDSWGAGMPTEAVDL